MTTVTTTRRLDEDEARRIDVARTSLVLAASTVATAVSAVAMLVFAANVG